jgi:O-antigen/teichoic acid export membrane protein
LPPQQALRGRIACDPGAQAPGLDDSPVQGLQRPERHLIGIARQRTISALRTARVVLRDPGKEAAAQRASVMALAIRLANAALAYVAQVVLARLMGQFEYGVFAFTWVWFMVFAAVATLGFGDSPIRYLPSFRERGEIDHLRGFLRFAGAVTALSSLAVGLLVIVVLSVAGPWMEAAYVLPMMLMGVALPFACIQSFLEGVGRSYGWTIPSLVPIYILRHGLLLLFMVAAVQLGFEATAVNAFVCLLLTLSVSLAYQATAILLRLRRTVPTGPRAFRVREWLVGSAPFSVLYGSAHLSSFADVLVLSFFVTPAEIAVYFAATRVIQVINLIPYAATVGAAPLFAATHARGDLVELQRLCRQVSLVTFVVAGLSVVAMVLGGHWLLDMFGTGYDDGYVPLMILAVGVAARVAAGPAEDLLNMTGYGRLTAATYLGVVVVNVALNVALIIPFGIVGAAVATSTALALRAAWLAVVAHRRLGIHTSTVAILFGGRWTPEAELRAPAE